MTSERFVWKDLLFDDEPIINRGGEGSGHFGHAGRPGQRGGSAPGEGDSGDKRYQMEGVNYRDVVSTAFRKVLGGRRIDAPFRLRQHDSASLFIAPDGEIYAAVGMLSHAELAQAVVDASLPDLPEKLAKYYREAPITNAEAAYDLVFGRAGSVRSVWVKPGGAQTGELSISMDRSVGQTPEQERAIADLFAEFPEREYSTHWSLWEKDNRVGNGSDRRSLMARIGMVERGGPGSGHFGHTGRPGQRGGSIPGEGTTVSEAHTSEWIRPASPELTAKVKDAITTKPYTDAANVTYTPVGRKVNGLWDAAGGSQFMSPDGEVFAVYSHWHAVDAVIPDLNEEMIAPGAWRRMVDAIPLGMDEQRAAGLGIMYSMGWLRLNTDKTGLWVELAKGQTLTRPQAEVIQDWLATDPNELTVDVFDIDQQKQVSSKGSTATSRQAAANLLGLTARGGPGSGHHGHAGRPGQRGGSAPGEGDVGGKRYMAEGTHEATAVEPLGVDRPPYGSARPSVDWEAQDLQDSAGRVTEASIRKDYASGNPDIAIYQSWVPTEDVPSEVLVEEEDDEPVGYDWEQYSPRSSFPPVKLLVRKDGEVEILDGNHRIRYFRDSDMQYIPAWVLDYRMAQEQYEDLVERVGTPSSGHHGHKGRPGQRGGSLPGDKQEEGGGKRKAWDPAAHNDLRVTGGKANITVRSVMQAIYEKTGWMPKGLNVANTAKAATSVLYSKYEESLRAILSRKLAASLRRTPMAVFTDSTDPNRVVVYIGGKAKAIEGGEDGLIYQQFLSHEFGHVMQRWYGFNLVGVIPNGEVPEHYAEAVRRNYRTEGKIREEYLSDLFAVAIMGTYKLETSGMEVFPPRSFNRDERGKMTVDILAAAKAPFTDADRSTMNTLLERLTDAAKGEPYPGKAPDANYVNPAPPEPPAAFRAGPPVLVHVFFDWGNGMGEILPVPIEEVPFLPETAQVIDMPDPQDEDEEPVERAGNAQSGHRGHKGRPGQRGGSLPGEGGGKAEGQTAREPKQAKGYTREQAMTLKEAMRSKTHAMVYHDVYKDIGDIKKAWLAPDGTVLGIGVPPDEYDEKLTAYGGWHHGDQIVVAIEGTGIPLLTVSESQAKAMGLGTARYWAAVRTANRLGFVRLVNTDFDLSLMFEGQLSPEQKDTVETMLYARAQDRQAVGRTGGELLIDHVEPGESYRVNAARFNEPESGDPTELPPAARALIGRSRAMRVTAQEYAVMLGGGIINRSAGLLRRMLTLADGPFIIGRGGPGSGHFGHEGRPGIRGGSLPSGVSGKYESEASAFKAVEAEGWTRNRQNVGANAPRYTSPRVQTGEQDGQPVWREQQVRLRFDGNTYYWETVDERFGIGQTAADAFGISGTRIVEGEEEASPSPKAGSSIGPPKGYRYRPSRGGLPSMGGSGGMGGRGAWGAYHGGRAKQADWKKHMAGDTMRSVIEERGGPTSGHWGHKGRPGERGGSQPGDGGAWPRYLKDSEGLHYPDYAFKGKAWQGGLRDANAANSWGLRASADGKTWLTRGAREVPSHGWWTNEHDDQPPPEGEGWVKEETESDGNTYYSNPELERLADQPASAEGFIDDYVENTHGWYNRWLREGGKFGSDEAKASVRSEIAAMDLLMDRSSIPEAVVAWRGMDDFGDRLRAGREFTDRGYTSTTLLSSILGEKPYDAYGNGGRPYEWKFAIQVPRGTQGYYVGRDHGHGGGTGKEYELMLDRGMRFRVLAIDSENKTGVLKVIGQNRGRIP